MATNFVYLERVCVDLISNVYISFERLNVCYSVCIAAPVHVVDGCWMSIEMTTMRNGWGTSKAIQSEIFTFNNNNNHHLFGWQILSVRQEHIIFYYLLSCFESAFQRIYITLNCLWCCRCCECDARAQEVAAGNSRCERKTFLFKLFMIRWAIR